ncbi:unnamed protein product [Pedinophyceae sp. YPF-701]|nr:unnamed protein product [Pedinophyceae sp. YPF-701]
MEHLPADVLSRIMAAAGPRSLARSKQVCSAWNRALGAPGVTGYIPEHHRTTLFVCAQQHAGPGGTEQGAADDLTHITRGLSWAQAHHADLLHADTLAVLAPAELRGAALCAPACVTAVAVCVQREDTGARPPQPCDAAGAGDATAAPQAAIQYPGARNVEVTVPRHRIPHTWQLLRDNLPAIAPKCRRLSLMASERGSAAGIDVIDAEEPRSAAPPPCITHEAWPSWIAQLEAIRLSCAVVPQSDGSETTAHGFLAASGPLPRLAELQVCNVATGTFDSPVFVLPAPDRCGGGAGLASLSLANFQLEPADGTGGDGTPLDDILQHSNLRRLSLQAVHVGCDARGDGGASALLGEAASKRLRGLRVLELRDQLHGDVTLDVDGWCDQLEELALGGIMHEKSAQGRWIAADVHLRRPRLVNPSSLARLSRLRSLEISYLREGAVHAAMETSAAANGPAVPLGAQLPLCLAPLHQLERLVLDRAGAVGADALAQLAAAMPGLQHLRLVDAWPADEELPAALASLRKLRALEVESSGSGGIRQGAVVNAAAALAGMPWLRRLSLRNMELLHGGKGADAAVGELASLTWLEDLDVAACGTRSRGVRTPPRALGHLRSLRRLAIGSRAMTIRTYDDLQWLEDLLELDEVTIAVAVSRAVRARARPRPAPASPTTERRARCTAGASVGGGGRDVRGAAAAVRGDDGGGGDRAPAEAAGAATRAGRGPETPPCAGAKVGHLLLTAGGGEVARYSGRGGGVRPWGRELVGSARAWPEGGAVSALGNVVCVSPAVDV